MGDNVNRFICDEPWVAMLNVFNCDEPWVAMIERELKNINGWPD